MPHFNEINGKDIPKKEMNLLRAQLHYRAGYARIKTGNVTQGIVTLFDAFNTAIIYYFYSHKKLISKKYQKEIEFIEEGELYDIFIKEEADDLNFIALDYHKFEEIAENAAGNKNTFNEFKKIEKQFKELMEYIGIIPYKNLPPLDESLL